MNISLQRPKIEHLQQIIILLQSVSQFIPPDDELESIWSRYCDQANLASVVAISEDSVIGFASIFFATRIRGGKVGYIEDVVVLSKYRNRGLGHKLINYLLQSAISRGCFKVSLQCSEENIDFYQKNRFREQGRSLQIHLAPDKPVED